MTTFSLVLNHHLRICHMKQLAYFWKWPCTEEFLDQTHHISLAPAGSHFKDVNLLGADFCSTYNDLAKIDYEAKVAELLLRS